MARPSKLTQETQERIITAIKLGSTYELAAGYGGVSYDTFNNWIQRGKAELERADRATKNSDIKAEEQSYVQFFEAVKRAESEAAVTWLAKIEKAASETWQAAAWKLERRYPQTYGKQAIDLTSNDKEVGTADSMAAALLIAQQQLAGWKPDGSGKG